MEVEARRPAQISSTTILVIVYLSLFLDNILLTVVVPIIPDFLYTLEHGSGTAGNNSTIFANSIEPLVNEPTKITELSETRIDHVCVRVLNKNRIIGSLSQRLQQSEKNKELIKRGLIGKMKEKDLTKDCSVFTTTVTIGKEQELVKRDLIDKMNERDLTYIMWIQVSFLLSSKAVIQLIMNPVIGVLTERNGYYLPLFTGTTTMLLTTILFAYGKSYSSLFVARSLHGLASACIGVSGMCLIAENFPNEKKRSRVMGIILGSIAMGVLLGYPFGGLFYDFVGKTTPFIVIGFLIFIDMGLQLFLLSLKPVAQANVLPTTWKRLLSDKLVMISAGAIWLSSSAIAILEPCLPLWLMTTIKPAKWQLGTVFIPDSLGYLLGTNFFGTIAYRFGHWKVAIAAMILEATAAIMVPTATEMVELVLPHFALGLAIGIVDAALVPLLASLVDTRHGASYGCVYALQQTAVSLAYSLGPIIGGELVPTIGFPWLLRVIGILNLLYCPLLLLFARGKAPQRAQTVIPQQRNVRFQCSSPDNELQTTTRRYDRFCESECEYDSIGPYISLYYCPCPNCKRPNNQDTTV